jgi:hypothetical protein
MIVVQALASFAVFVRRVNGRQTSASCCYALSVWAIVLEYWWLRRAWY